MNDTLTGLQSPNPPPPEESWFARRRRHARLNQPFQYATAMNEAWWLWPLAAAVGGILCWLLLPWHLDGPVVGSRGYSGHDAVAAGTTGCLAVALGWLVCRVLSGRYALTGSNVAISRHVQRLQLLHMMWLAILGAIAGATIVEIQHARFRQVEVPQADERICDRLESLQLYRDRTMSASLMAAAGCSRALHSERIDPDRSAHLFSAGEDWVPGLLASTPGIRVLHHLWWLAIWAIAVQVAFGTMLGWWANQRLPWQQALRGGSGVKTIAAAGVAAALTWSTLHPHEVRYLLNDLGGGMALWHTPQAATATALLVAVVGLLLYVNRRGPPREWTLVGLLVGIVAPCATVRTEADLFELATIALLCTFGCTTLLVAAAERNGGARMSSGTPAVSTKHTAQPGAAK